MAKTNAPAKEKLSFPKKFVRFFKNRGLRIVGSFKDMYSELKKVTLPTRKDVYKRQALTSGGATSRSNVAEPTSRIR